MCKCRHSNQWCVRLSWHCENEWRSCEKYHKSFLVSSGRIRKSCQQVFRSKFFSYSRGSILRSAINSSTLFVRNMITYWQNSGWSLAHTIWRPITQTFLSQKLSLSRFLRRFLSESLLVWLSPLSTLLAIKPFYRSDSASWGSRFLLTYYWFIHLFFLLIQLFP